MLQMAVLRDNPAMVKERLTFRGFGEPELVDKILELDGKRRSAQARSEEIQSQLNQASKKIPELMKSGQKAEAEEMKASVGSLKSAMEPLAAEARQLEEQLNELLLRLPNLPSEQVPAGKTPEDNVVVREGGQDPSFSGEALPHWELAKKYSLIDFELGNKITGSGFPVYTGDGARLQRALVGYFLDFNTSAGYYEYLPPFMVNEASGFGTGQLPDKEGQMYFMPADNYYMIPTAEVPVTNIYRDTMLKPAQLPVKMTAYTPCFRREAGSYGKDVRGLNRLHQFEKVEIIQIAHPDESYKVLEEMVAHVEKLIRQLGLRYRILRLCAGDMGFTSALTYDFEVWSGAQQRWLEVSSVSNFETFQAARLRCRFKDTDGKPRLVHTLNGSSLALPRIVAALLENNQDGDSINIPEALRPYFGKVRIGG